MRISRLYTPAELTTGKQIELDNENAHYVRTVLRLKKDVEIILFNGSAGEYLCSIIEVSRRAVVIDIKQWDNRSVESTLTVHLGLGISRGDRMDFSVQKVVELGVNVITPLLTERCQVQFRGEKKSQRWMHWQKIVQHATEQSGRTLLPDLLDIDNLSTWVTQQQGLKVFLDPYAEHSLADLERPTQVTLLVGPEGGFSDTERTVAKAAGFIPVRMGARILRTETAALAALSAVQVLWGDFGVARKLDDQ